MHGPEIILLFTLFIVKPSEVTCTALFAVVLFVLIVESQVVCDK